LLVEALQNLCRKGGKIHVSTSFFIFFFFPSVTVARSFLHRYGR
jgi:hypothetical protein